MSHPHDIPMLSAVGTAVAVEVTHGHRPERRAAQVRAPARQRERTRERATYVGEVPGVAEHHVARAVPVEVS